MKEYKEDVKELETLAATKKVEYLSETRSAKALSKRIDKLVADLDQIVQSLDKKQDDLKKDIKVTITIRRKKPKLELCCSIVSSFIIECLNLDR